MKLLFDENLPRKLADALARLGLPVEHVEQHGLTQTSDTDIFEYCRSNEFVLVSADLRIHRDKTERAAIDATGIGVVEVKLGDCSLFEQARHFLDRAEELNRVLAQLPPFHYHMTRKGFRSDQQNERRRRR
jgi:predicted nuclease of predicted toxin-antitoxin system